MSGDIEVKRNYYYDLDNVLKLTEQPYAEFSRKGNILHGICKKWYRNGVLAFQGEYDNGVPVSGCYWDKRGREMCRYELCEGTGTEVTIFIEDGTRVETPWVNGKKHGIENYCSGMGRVTNQGFWVNGRNVHRAQYIEACEQDPTLPKWSPPNQDEDPNQWALDILAAGNTYEAAEWIKDRTHGEATLGEGWSWKKSLSVIQRFYALGADKVYAFDVDDETRNSGRLLIELPADADKREAVLKECNKWPRKQGFDPERDKGQRHTLVMLD